MSNQINIAPMAHKEEKLQIIADYLEELKDALTDVLEEYEAEDAKDADSSSEKLDTLTEALDALEDAFDAINDVVLDEM